MKFKYIVLLFVCSFVGCGNTGSSPEVNASDPCAYRITGAPLSCEVSPTHLLVVGESMEGRDIAVVLYYPGFGSDLLFASREAAETHDLASGFVVEWPVLDAKLLDENRSLRPGYYRIRARFQRVSPLVVGEDVVMPVVVAGRLAGITELTRVRTVAEIRESCAKTPNCTMDYLHGIFPIPKLDPPPKAAGSL